MNNEETLRIKKLLKLIPITFFIISVMFMYNGYKCLSGLIANNFDDLFRMLAMVISYMYPVICFLCFIYNYYIKKFNKIFATIYSFVTISVSLFNLINIIININFYISNNNLGMYVSIPSIFNSFPYDGIATNIFLIAVQIINLISIFKPNSKINEYKMYLEDYNFFKLNTVEYLLLSILAIFTFIFIGATFNGLNAIENATYDPKYILILLWVFITPLLNLIMLSIKFENRNIKHKLKLISLISTISINVLFMFLIILFEAIYPSYMVYISKPIFLIAFSVSLPIEMLLILVIQLISIIIISIRLILLLKKNMEDKTICQN